MEVRCEAVVPGSQEFRVRLFCSLSLSTSKAGFIGASVMGIFVAKYVLYSGGVLLSGEGFLRVIFYISS